MSPLAAFSSITVHNCLTSGMDGTSIPLELNLSISFPAPRYDMREDARPLSASWDALPLPETAGHLDLTIVSSLIGEGRIGLVYFARVNAVADAEGNDISGKMPAEVCLKIAKPTYCRSLAREAWFYEQLQEWQGVATAKCYGLFTAPVPPDTSVRPWKESDEFPHEFRLPQSDVESADWLPDDPIGRAYKFSLESLHVVEGSSWFKWTPDETDQRLAILVLEKLGPHYYSQDEEPKTDREALQCVHSIDFVPRSLMCLPSLANLCDSS